MYRRRHLAAAKLHTLQFVRYMQTALGHPEWQIAEDEYPTADHLPPIPYIRESRRLVNDHVMVMDDVVPRGDDPRAPVVPDSVAVGDYFLDHHHLKHHLPPGERLFEEFPDNGPFQVPIGVFFPPGDDESFLVGEKSIAVTHIVNGCTRLQPTVMLMGQALGVIAAQAVGGGVAPASVPVRDVQDALLDAGCQLYIMYDVPVGHALFRPVQELALEGVLGAEAPTTLEPEAPIPAAWAERWAARAGLAEAVRPAGRAAPNGVGLGRPAAALAGGPRRHARGVPGGASRPPRRLTETPTPGCVVPGRPVRAPVFSPHRAGLLRSSPRGKTTGVTPAKAGPRSDGAANPCSGEPTLGAV